ncbi:SdrD B-like domain-containing protein [Agreia sp. PsM10]|uniref:SdrD B-like domain-containing protein n=1 Tax=Agreia sp. PsM10 TaxID=3030533 RepID=UPI00263AAA5F|nr:SdrD B-like domain-containing protein [Agreia sp. PsM10]MDN4639953.1 SdrD B-like domain-containing protein [Agreia sp. PsM10]
MPSRLAVIRRVRALLSFVAITALTASAVAIAAPAYAAGESLNVVVAQTDGTPTFDALDANATNGIVRTNDTVSYIVSVQTLGGAQTAPTITFDLPQGQELVSLPNYCLTGSSVTPTTIGSLTPPITATSWTTYPVQTVVCVLADRGVDPTTNDYGFVAKVAAEIPNGTVLDEFTASATSTAVSDQQPIASPESNALQVTVAAAPRFDLSKNGTSDVDDNSAYIRQNTTTCTTQRMIDAGFVGCQVLQFPVLISVPEGGKGNNPLSSDITFVDDISPAALWGAAAVANPEFDPAFAPAVVSCGPVDNSVAGASFFYPYGSIAAGGSSTNSVRDSGTFDCDQDAAGGPVTVSISGADTSAKTYPATNGSNNVAMPAGKAYVVSGYILVEFPTAALSAIGVEAEPGQNTGSFSLPYENVYTELASTDLTGTALPDEANTENNVVRGSSTIDLSNGFSKTFLGEPGNAANSGGSGYAAGTIAGPPGSQDGGDGRGIVQPGGKVLSGLSLQMDNPPGIGASTQVVCDAWDNTKIAITEAQWRGAQAGTTSAAAASPTIGYLQQLPSNGAAVWLTNYSSPAAPAVTYEFSNGTPGTASVNSCRDETTGWYSSPAAVPGNDATLAAQGVYTGVSRVRAVVQVPSDVSADFSFSGLISIGFTVLPAAATGDVIGNWGSSYISYSDGNTPPTLAEVQADPRAIDYDSTYVPSNDTGTRGDRVTVQAVTARIIKSVWNPATSTYVSDGVPVYSTGVNVNYKLQPTLTSGTTTGQTAAVTIEDCLPAEQSFQSSSLEGGTAIAPNIITAAGAPDGSELDCAAGNTYLRWDLGEQPINTPLPAILYTVEVIATAPNGTETNTALVTAVGDASSVAARRDTAQIQIQTPTGIKLAKTTLTPVIDVNPVGITNPRTLDWTISFAAIDTSGVSNVDIIDVLPANGLNGTSFTGTLAFDTATATASTGTATLLYTKAAPASISGNPDAASNAAGGTTVWCDAPAGGAVVSGAGSAADCPAAASAVTGLRILRAGAFSAGSTVTVEVSMTPSGNTAGDVYNNSTQADAQGVLQGVGPVARAITVASSSIGDYVWNDVNGNGLQDAGEPAIPGFPVSLTGTDIDGNTITAATTTDAAGNYLFAGLPQGTYTVTFDPAGLGDTYSFAQYKQGTDGALDSDADQTTGEAPAVTLAQSEQRLDVDAGLTRNQTASIILTKVVVDPDTSDTAGDATSFPVTITCTVPENPTPIVIETTVAADGTPTEVTGLPVGATCVIVETDTDGAVVTYSVENGTITTIGEPVDVTITNTFPGTSVAKQVVGAPVKNADGSYAITYDVTVSNTGKVDTVYTVEDELHYGAGIVVDNAEITDSPDGVDVNDGWNGVTDLVIAEDIDIPVDGVHVYRVVVTATVPTTVTTGARNCEVGTGETGTGFLNSATVVTDRGETTASDCAPAPEEPVVPVAKPGTGSLPNTGANVTVGLAALLGLMLAGGVALVISRRRRVE